MSKGRLEAFSDAVIAIIMTIMVLELRPPEGTDLAALQPLAPVFLAYLLSFVYLAIYWVNHHHLLQATQRVTGGILWANIALLFWLSLLPFATSWIGEHRGALVPTLVYGLVLLADAISYFILQVVIVRAQGPDSQVAVALGRDLKGKASLVLYVTALVVAFVSTVVAIAIFVVVAIMWLVPDRRIERMMNATGA
ncbi:MAG: TMEM175 family protein [Candidatus Nanopelagicales bacterium]|nr:TMEM175 family protein [Candidatus Nanopelagicales bacterium]